MINENTKRNLVHNFIIGTFVSLYAIVSIISTIHVIDFFKLSNPNWLAISLAIAFEIGAAASLAALIILEKTNKNLVWFLFITLAGFQMMGNTYYAFIHLHDFQGWVDLFGLSDSDVIEQKRILSFISGAILPLVSLGFIKSLVDYIKPDVEELANEYEGEKYIKDKEQENEYISKINDDEVLEEETILEAEADILEEVEPVKEVEVISVDGGDSVKRNESTRILSPEHYTVIPNANSNKKEPTKRYPENLE